MPVKPILPADTATRLAGLEQFFVELAAHSHEVPILPEEALTRESVSGQW